MGRDELLRQRKEKEEALKEIAQKFKDPLSVKYELFDDEGRLAGYLEYQPKDDKIGVNAGGWMSIDGKVIKSLRDALNKLLDE